MTRMQVESGSPYEDLYGFVRGLRRGRRVEIAGTAPIPEPGEKLAPSAYEQMLRCGDITIKALEQMGSSADEVIRTRIFITDAADADEIGRAHRQLFGVARPVATMVVVAGLLDPAWKVEIEVEALTSDPHA